jgi:hypothetical protein
MSFNSNSRCLTSVAALTLAVFFTAGLAHGQANDIKWRSGPQAIAIQDSTQSAAQISSELDAGRSHMIVQFDAPLSAADRQQLNAAGVEVLDYLSNNAYFAKVSPQRFNAAGLTQIQVAMSATPVDSTHKLHPMLDAGEVAPWAIVEAKLAANPDVKEGSIEAASELIPEIRPWRLTCCSIATSAAPIVALLSCRCMVDRCSPSFRASTAWSFICLSTRSETSSLKMMSCGSSRRCPP